MRKVPGSALVVTALTLAEKPRGEAEIRGLARDCAKAAKNSVRAGQTPPPRADGTTEELCAHHYGSVQRCT